MVDVSQARETHDEIAQERRAQCAAAMLAVVSEPTRWRVIRLLASKGTQCVCDIEPAAGVPTNVLNYHLRALREVGLITSAQRDKWVDYTLASDAGTRLSAALPTSAPRSSGGC